MQKTHRRPLVVGISLLVILAIGFALFLVFHKGGSKDESGNLVVNGSFEQPEVPPLEKGGDRSSRRQLWLRADPDEMQPWQTDLDGFEIWANGLLMPRGKATVGISPARSAVGNQNIEIISDPLMVNGEWQMKGSVWQTIKTQPGKRYVFWFYHSERPGAHTTLTVLLNENVVATIHEDGTVSGSLKWEQFKTNFTADRAFTTIKFSDETDVLGQGTHLDGVVVKAE